MPNVSPEQAYAALIKAFSEADNAFKQVLSGALPAGANNIGDVDVLSLPTLPAGTNRIGRIEYNAPTTGQLTRGVISSSSLGDNTIISGVANQTIRVFKLFLVVTLGVSLQFKDGASTNLSGAIPLGANGTMVLEFDGEPWFITSSGNAFIINLSVGTLIAGTIYYTQS